MDVSAFLSDQTALTQRVTSTGAPAETRSTMVGPISLASPDALTNILNYADAGTSVTDVSAMQVAAVWACIRRIAEIMACLPLRCVEHVGDQHVPDNTNPIPDLINLAPNSFMSGTTFKDLATTQVLRYGNHYSYIIKKDSPYATELWPLKPENTLPAIYNGELWYLTTIGNERKRLRPDQVFHLIGFSQDGIFGEPPIKVHDRTIGHALALDKYSSRFFGNGATLQGFFKYPGRLSDTAKKNFLGSFAQVHAGVDQSFKNGLLEEGMDFIPTSVDPEKSQLVEVRKYSVLDICRIFGMQPHMVGELNQAWATIDQQSIDLLKYTMRIWLERWESECHRKLLLESEKPTHRFHFDVEVLLRGEPKAQLEALQIGRNIGIYSINDCRHKLHQNPIEDGDRYLEPLNMSAVGQDAKISAQEIQSLSSVITSVASGQMPRDSGLALLEKIVGDKKEAAKLLGSAGEKKEPDGPEPAPAKPQNLGPDQKTPPLAGLFKDALGRINTKETKALKRAVKKYLPDEPEAFADWLDDFYADHELHIRSVLAPVVADEALLSKYIVRHIEESKSEIRQAGEPEAVEALLDVWLAVRADDESKVLEAECRI